MPFIYAHFNPAAILPHDLVFLQEYASTYASIPIDNITNFMFVLHFERVFASFFDSSISNEPSIRETVYCSFVSWELTSCQSSILPTHVRWSLFFVELSLRYYSRRV
jgi:hypothetical protein